jgi:hypothetical protein
MATPGQLVQVMADVLGISKATVIQYDRVLSENGLRSKSGRGKSAAQVTSRDAANLLMALAASPLFGLSAKDAVTNCEAYASMFTQPVSQAWSKHFASFGLPTLSNLPEKHSFGEALSTLIDAAGRGENFKTPESEKKRYSMSTSFEIQFIGPGPSAQILADGAKEFGLLARLIYADARQSKRSRPRLVTKAGLLKIPDLHQISSISFKTISALGALVCER